MKKKEKYNQFESERQAKENLRKYPNESERSLIEKTDGNFNKKFSDNSHNNHNYQEDSLDRIQTDLQGIRTVPVSGALRNRKEKSRWGNGNRRAAKKQISGFSKFLIIYCSAALVLISVFLIVFRQYIAAYENTRDEHIIKNRLSEMTASEIDDMTAAFPLCKYENSELIADRLNSAVKSGTFSCLKASADDNGVVRTYNVFSDGIRLAEVTVENIGEKASFGFEKSEITSISLGSANSVGSGDSDSSGDFDGRKNVRLIFPRKSEVWINGFRADGERSLSEIVYPLASIYEKNSSELPNMSVCEVSGFVIEPSVEASLDGTALKAVRKTSEDFDEYIFDFPDSEKYSMIITAPEEASVCVGGIELTERELKESGIPYDSYVDNAFNRAAGELPTNHIYRIEGLLTIPECSVLLDGDIIPCSESNILSGEIYYTYSRSAEQLFHAEIHVPDGTAVFVNGIELGTELLKSSDYIYDEISDFSDLVETPLTEQLYVVDGLYKRPVVEIKRDDGRTEVLNETDKGVYKIEIMPDDTLKDLNSAVVEDFLTKYVEYTAAGYTDAGSKSKFGAMLDCAMEKTQAYEILYSTRNSFVQNLPCDILSLDINTYDYRKWGDNCFSCTADFTAELRNFSYKTDQITGWKLYFTEKNDKWYLVKLNFE